MWEETQDKQLKKYLNAIAKKMGVSVRYLRQKIYSLHLDDEKEQPPRSIQSMLAKFPNLSTAQMQQAKAMWEQNPSSALRYCKACQNYRVKKQNEPKHLRYENRKKD